MSKIIYQVNSTPFLGENQQYHYLYRIINLSNMMEYTGVCSTNKKNFNEYYSGSGKYLKRAQKKYGMGVFIKLIDEFFYTEKQMYKRESEIVDEEYIKREDTYNLKIGGYGKWCHSKEISNKISLSKLGKKLGPCSEIRKKNIKISLKTVWENKIYKSEMIKKFRSKEHREKLSASIKNTWKNEEYKEKISLARKITWKNKEYRNKKIKSLSKKVKCIETGKIFNSTIEASLFFNKNKHAVSNSIFKNGSCAGYHWEYIED